MVGTIASVIVVAVTLSCFELWPLNELKMGKISFVWANPLSFFYKSFLNFQMLMTMMFTVEHVIWCTCFILTMFAWP